MNVNAKGTVWNVKEKKEEGNVKEIVRLKEGDLVHAKQEEGVLVVVLVIENADVAGNASELMKLKKSKLAHLEKRKGKEIVIGNVSDGVLNLGIEIVKEKGRKKRNVTGIGAKGWNISKVTKAQKFVLKKNHWTIIRIILNIILNPIIQFMLNTKMMKTRKSLNQIIPTMVAINMTMNTKKVKHINLTKFQY